MNEFQILENDLNTKIFSKIWNYFLIFEIHFLILEDQFLIIENDPLILDNTDFVHNGLSYHLFRFVSICFVSFCLLSIWFISFRVSFLFRFALYSDPKIVSTEIIVRDS